MTVLSHAQLCRTNLRAVRSHPVTNSSSKNPIKLRHRASGQRHSTAPVKPCLVMYHSTCTMYHRARNDTVKSCTICVPIHTQLDSTTSSNLAIILVVYCDNNLTNEELYDQLTCCLASGLLAIFLRLTTSSVPCIFLFERFVVLTTSQRTTPVSMFVRYGIRLSVTSYDCTVIIDDVISTAVTRIVCFLSCWL